MEDLYATLIDAIDRDDIDEIPGTLSDIWRAGVPPRPERIAPLLAHPEADVQSEAIRLLCYRWELQEFRPAAERLWRADGDEYLRGAALMSWAGFDHATGSTDTLDTLWGVLTDPSLPELLRMEARGSLFAVAGVPAKDRPRFLRSIEDMKEDDWQRVRELVGRAG